MKVRICYTVTVDDDFREAIRRYYGEKGLATRQEIRDWFMTHGQTLDDDVMSMQTFWAEMDAE